MKKNLKRTELCIFIFHIVKLQNHNIESIYFRMYLSIRVKIEYISYFQISESVGIFKADIEILCDPCLELANALDRRAWLSGRQVRFVAIVAGAEAHRPLTKSNKWQ